MKDAIKNPYGPALIEIEGGLLDHDVRVGDGAAPYDYDDDTFRTAVFIFMGAVMCKLWEKMEGEPFEKQVIAATECGDALRGFVQDYCGIDT